VLAVYTIEWTFDSHCILLSHHQSVEKELQKEGKSAKALENKKDASTKKVAEVKAQLGKLNFSESEYNAIEQEKDDLESSVTELSERVDTLSAQLQGPLSFRYSDPVRGFDRSKVKGLVAKLINVKDSKHSTALEVVAGNKLFQVVIENPSRAKLYSTEGSSNVVQPSFQSIRSNRARLLARRAKEHRESPTPCKRPHSQ
jgi:structural maintenance of chromosome 2